MKKKIVQIILCFIISISVLTGCSQTGTIGGTQSSETANEDTTGQVTAIKGDKITLALGTMEKTDIGASSDDGGEAPSGNPPSGEAPSGEAPSGETPSGEAPSGEKPSGEAPSGEKPSGGPGGSFSLNGEEKIISVSDATTYKIQKMGQTSEGSLGDVEKGSILTVSMEGDIVKSITIINQGGGKMEGQQSSTGAIELSGVYSVDGKEETKKDETYSSANADESTVLIKNKGTLTLSSSELSKSGDTTSEDESNFYGVNAVLTAAGGSKAELTDMTITSDAEGANALFATGEGSEITVDNVKINTTGNSSRGLDATYGGKITATNVDIKTNGAHCAPIATDRGEGTIQVTDGIAASEGEGSPCIYSTGDISVKNLTGTATGAQAAVVEGKNSISIEDSNLTGAGENGVMLYQSTSGDAAEGTAEFSAVNSSITTTTQGPMFYITNTKASATLENTTLDFSSGILINAAGNSTNNWGKEGENGGDFTLKGIGQTLTGDVACDKISTVKLNLTKSSTYTGTVNQENTGKKVTVSLDDSSIWNVTGDSYITVLKNKTEDCSNIISNGNTIYYDASNSANEWLDGKTIILSDGGKITPVK